MSESRPRAFRPVSDRHAVTTTAASTTSMSASGARRTNRSHYIWHALPRSRPPQGWRQWQSRIAGYAVQIVLIDEMLGADSGRLEPARSNPPAHGFGIASCTASCLRYRQHCRYILQQLGDCAPRPARGAALGRTRRGPDIDAALGRVTVDLRELILRELELVQRDQILFELLDAARAHKRRRHDGVTQHPRDR